MEEKSTIVFNVKSAPTTTPSETYRITRGGYSPERKEEPYKPKPISEEKFRELAKKYETVCIHDYGDEYHMSEEERAQKNKYYEVFSKIIRCKRKYQKIDEYVRTFRLCLECLQEVAENNGVYDPEKFIKLVMKGEIEVYGLNFPKYTGKDKKSINWNYIAAFIMSDEDPKNLVVRKDDQYIEYSDSDAFEQFFSEEEQETLLSLVHNSIENRDDSITPYYGDDDEHEENEFLAVAASKKETRNLISSTPELVRTIRETEKARKKNRALNANLRSYAFDMTEDDYREIEKMDKARGLVSDSDVPKFKGDISKKKDYKRYLWQLHQYELENIKENYQGKMRTLEDIRELQLKDSLERAGWNLRALYKQKDKEKKLKKAYKEDKRREESLKKKLLAIQQRQDKRKKSDIKYDSKKKKKKKESDDDDD